MAVSWAILCSRPPGEVAAGEKAAKEAALAARELEMGKEQAEAELKSAQIAAETDKRQREVRRVV